jgi:signal transduction histidine kinase
VSIDPLAPTYLIGDPTRLRQVLINLFGNAIKFTNEASVARTITTHIRSVGADCELQCRVSDTGEGIKDDLVDATTRKYGGTEKARGFASDETMF